MAGIESPTWIGERLREEGVISAAALRLAVQNMALYGERMEEALLRSGALDEPRLLQFVAAKCRTNYVSTRKLANLTVPREALHRLSERVADKLLAFPVRFDRAAQVLTLVSPDAGNPEYAKQVAIGAGLKSIQLYVARPAAVKAAIAKWYRGDTQAFADILPDTFTQIQSTVDMYERQMLDEGGLTRRPQAASRPPAPEYFRTPLSFVPAEPTLAPPTPPPEPSSIAPRRALAPPDVPTSPSQLPDRRIADLAEMLRVLVALSENANDQKRGHSGSCARIMRLMAERLSLDETATLAAQLAAQMHDLGKTVAYHLTALNVAEYSAHRLAAQRLHMVPLRLLENVELPQAATSAVAGMYERYDGQGFPSKLSGKDIPLGARLLALCDAYTDLTLSAGNAERRPLSHEEAMPVLSKHRGTVFDPDLLDLLHEIVAGEELRRRLGTGQPLVLLVEPSPEEATVLELRLVAQGFDVRVVRSADAALTLALDGGVSCVFAEVELTPFGGFELLSRLRADERTRALPFIFVAKSSDTATIERSFSLGAQDYVVKPTSGDVLAAKLRRLPNAKARREVHTGVAGSLSEMGLPDLAQIMAHGRKSGLLRLQSAGRQGEVHFASGRIVHASFEQLRGELAFYELLALSEGNFAFDPTFQPSHESINASHETLILEGFRRLDERARTP